MYLFTIILTYYYYIYTFYIEQIPVADHAEPHNNNNNNNLNFNNDNNNFDQFELNDEAEAVGGVEVRLALFELLGMEGPFHLMFRNSFWLLGFCSLYLFFSIMLPYVIGKMLFKVFGTILITYLIPSTIKDFIQLVHQYSGLNIPMQGIDFFYVFSGFAGIFLAVFGIDLIATMISHILKLPNYFKIVVELINKLTLIIKVGSLLIVRIFLLPLCLGECKKPCFCVGFSIFFLFFIPYFLCIHISYFILYVCYRVLCIYTINFLCMLYILY